MRWKRPALFIAYIDGNLSFIDSKYLMPGGWEVRVEILKHLEPSYRYKKIYKLH